MAFTGRITVFFEQGEFGWTETLFNNATTYPTLFAQGLAYCQTRAGLLAASSPPIGPVIVGYRVSDDTVFRDSQVQFFQPPLGSTGTTPADPLPADVALICRLTATPLSRRPLYLSGLPLSIIDGNGQYAPTPAWLGAINNLRTLLTNGQWNVKGQLGVGEPLALSLAAVSPPNNFTTTPPNTYNVGNVVRIKGRRRPHYPLGLFKISKITTPGAQFQVTGLDLPADFMYTAGDLSSQLQQSQFNAITTFSDERITKRGRGRPIASPRGRRSAIPR